MTIKYATAKIRLFFDMMIIFCSLFSEDFDGATVLGVDVHAVGFEVEEIGAGGNVVLVGVPPVVVAVDVLPVEDAMTPTVVDGEFVVLEAVVLNETLDDEAVVDAVAVGGDIVGVFQRGVAVVTVPEDIEVVVDDAVAAGFVEGEEVVVGDGVGEKGIEEEVGELGIDNGVIDGGIGGGDDVDDVAECAVFTVDTVVAVGADVVAVEGEGVDGEEQRLLKKIN